MLLLAGQEDLLRTARLPSEWMTVDSATTEAKARERLRRRFEACYPFHPSTLSVFRRKWSALAQFQQTRGTLAMLAQWVSWAARRQFQQARTEALITLGSAPLDVPEFRAVVLGQLCEQRLDVTIAADLAGRTAHAGALSDSNATPARLCVSGTIPPELWNRLGTKVIPKLRAGTRITVGVEFSVDIPESVAGSIEADLRQMLTELDLETGVKVERRTTES